MDLEVEQWVNMETVEQGTMGWTWGMFNTETRMQTVLDTMSYCNDEHQRLGEDHFSVFPTGR
jgi:hypothetical protein